MAYLNMMLIYSPSIIYMQQPKKKVSLKQRTRMVNSEILTNFQSLLKQETWQSVYQTQGTNNMFNSFLSTLLHIFEACFPANYRSTKEKKKDWITQGFKISSKRKRSLYTLTKNRNDPKAKAHYIKYCRILKKVIKEAKKQFYDSLMAKSDNKIKATWNIIKNEIGRMHPIEQVPSSLVNIGKLKVPTTVANTFNNIFLTNSEKLNVHKFENGDAISFLKDPFPGNFPNINIIPITEAEIKVIISSLKPKTPQVMTK